MKEERTGVKVIPRVTFQDSTQSMDEIGQVLEWEERGPGRSANLKWQLAEEWNLWIQTRGVCPTKLWAVAWIQNSPEPV
jgi:hypothetical protein